MRMLHAHRCTFSVDGIINDVRQSLSIELATRGKKKPAGQNLTFFNLIFSEPPDVTQFCSDDGTHFDILRTMIKTTAHTFLHFMGKEKKQLG